MTAPIASFDGDSSRRRSSTRLPLSLALVAAVLLSSGGCDWDEIVRGKKKPRSPSPVPAVVTGPLPAPGQDPGPVSLPVPPGAGPTGLYDIGTFTGRDIWVDPLKGNDFNDGTDRAHAVRTVAAAWQRIPAGSALGTGYRMQLAAGTYAADTLPNYWEDRRATASGPVILNAVDGAHTVTFKQDMNVFGVSYFYVIGVDIVRDGDVFHCEQCDHVVLRDMLLSGGNGAHETVKVNQSQHIYIERADISGADDNSIDFVAVQYGHVKNSRIHGAGDWCMYAKGGSAYIDIVGNEVFDCGTGGISAGQGTGFEFMQSPWLHYEAYGVRIYNNVVHHTEGAGLGVNGGYNILLAYNTLYRVGSRSHTVEFVHGSRGCDGDSARCSANRAAGGWGSAATEGQWIPSRHIFFSNNVVYNPPGAATQWQHLTVAGPVDPPSASGVPGPSRADEDLRITGNVIWNGSADMPLGVGAGCADTNPTCNAAQILANNSVNSRQPFLVDPEHGDFRLTDAARASLPPSLPITSFSWADTPARPAIPAGTTVNEISTDRAGNARVGGGPPGA